MVEKADKKSPKTKSKYKFEGKYVTTKIGLGLTCIVLRLISIQGELNFTKSFFDVM